MDILLEGGSVLRDRDYTLIIDSSQSMATIEKSKGKSRWDLIQESILAIASYCEQFDLDGITLYLFSDQLSAMKMSPLTELFIFFNIINPREKIVYLRY